MANRRRDFLGTMLGLVMLVGGVCLLLLTFKYAFDLFSTDPKTTLGLTPNDAKPADLNNVAANFVALLARVVLLLVMCVIASALATRGIRMYAASHVPATPTERQPENE